MGSACRFDLHDASAGRGRYATFDYSEQGCTLAGSPVPSELHTDRRRSRYPKLRMTTLKKPPQVCQTRARKGVMVSNG